MKQKAKKVIEFLRLGKAADLARFQLEKRRNKSKNTSFLNNNPDVVLPEPFMIYETFNLNYEKYINTGREDAEWIKSEVENYISFKNSSILDWGCGPGRVIRHFPVIIDSSNKIMGCDYNHQYVDWCKQNLNEIHFFYNDLNPPLKLKEKSLDLVYGLSIFTHLSEDNHYAWINEMYRILKNDGILFITTHGEITKNNLLPSEINEFDNGELVIRGNIKEGYRMYCAYHPISFIEKIIKDKFLVLKHKPGEKKDWGLEQDLWILKKM